MDKIWKSKIYKSLKIMLFRATTEMILLHRSHTWALTASEEKAMNGTYTRMLRKVRCLTWKDQVDKKNNLR